MKISPLTGVRFLRSCDYDVATISLEEKGVPDEIVIQKAIDESRLLLTFDSDYGKLIFLNKIYPPEGVIYLRLPVENVLLAGVFVAEILNRPGFSTKYQLTIFNGQFTRQRSYAAKQ